MSADPESCKLRVSPTCIDPPPVISTRDDEKICVPSYLIIALVSLKSTFPDISKILEDFTT